MEKKSHIKLYKKKIPDIEELRRRRSETGIELRKSKREEALLKRRNISADHSLEDEDDTLAIGSHPIDEIFQSNDMPKIFSYIQSVRKLLSATKNPPIDYLINQGILPKLIICLGMDDNPKLQFEACWAVTNIASGTSRQTNAVLNSGALHYLIRLLSSPHRDVCEQSVWALGNMIGEGPVAREAVLAAGVLKPLVDLAMAVCTASSSTSPTSVPGSGDAGDRDQLLKSLLPFLRNLTWVVINLCRHKHPPPSDHVIVHLLPIMARLLKNGLDDAQILIDTFWAICYVTDIGPQQIQYAVEAGIVPAMVPFLDHCDVTVKTSALRALGNIVTGSDMQTQLVLECGALTYFPSLLTQADERLTKEALWFISNVAAGNKDQVQLLIDYNLIPFVLLCLNSSQFAIQKEAIWAITNFAIGGTKEQVLYLVQQGALPQLCTLLSLKDSQLQKIILEAMTCILRSAEPYTKDLIKIVEDCEGVSRIETLYNGPNGEVSSICKSLMDNYFSDQDKNDAIFDGSEDMLEDTQLKTRAAFNF